MPNDEERNDNDGINVMGIDAHRLPMVGVLFSAIILLISLTGNGGPGKGGYLTYGIVLTVVAMFFALVGLGLSHKPELVKDRPEVMGHLGHFLFLWTFTGACIMTFGNGPFVITSNGYFSAWGMAIFAIMGIGVSFGSVRNAGSLVGHLACAIIMIIALATFGWQSSKGNAIFAIILAGLSLFLMGYQIRSQRSGETGVPENLFFPIIAVLAIAWIVMAILVTTGGPFIFTGNGYFAAWAGAISATIIAVESNPNK